MRRLPISPRHEGVTGTARVLPGEWRMGQRSDVLYTRGLGACLGIAVHDTITRIGHMAHIFSTESSQKEMLDPLMASVRSHSVDPSNLIAFVTGASSEAHASNTNASDAILRTKAITRLSELGLAPDNLHVYFNNDEQLLVDMSLVCETGEFNLVEVPVIPARQ